MGDFHQFVSRCKINFYIPPKKTTYYLPYQAKMDTVKISREMNHVNVMKLYSASGRLMYHFLPFLLS